MHDPTSTECLIGSPNQALSFALEAARERGRTWIRSEMASPANLSADQVVVLIGVSKVDLAKGVEDAERYQLIDGTSESRYPAWQFSLPAARLKPLLVTLNGLAISAWGIHAFLTTPSSDLEGKSPAAALLDNSFDLDRVINTARSRFLGDQGG
jgi:hypothetical protein